MRRLIRLSIRCRECSDGFRGAGCNSADFNQVSGKYEYNVVAFAELEEDSAE